MSNESEGAGKEKGHCLIWDTVPTFAFRHWGQLRKMSG